MKTTLQIALCILVIVLAVDFFGFAAWIVSGQHPQDNFYVGTITAHALQAVIK